MSFEFYLFDVDHGQSAAIKVPNGSWCLFDAGASDSLSPTAEINRMVNGQSASQINFKYYKATIGHFHGDHLCDYEQVFRAGPNFFRTVAFDDDYLADAEESSAPESYEQIEGFAQRFKSVYTGSGTPDYGQARVREMSLPVAVARQVGGGANSRVNNASIVSRIECYGNVLLLCGDLEKEGWEYALSQSSNAAAWKELVSNVDILVAPHHGHASSFSVEMMGLAKPRVVVVSVRSGDDQVDGRYSGDLVSGIKIGETEYKAITTRTNGTVHVTVAPPEPPATKGKRTWHNL
jgi:beta-lactamase superfamily II metal-dependent hydrolase